MDTAGMENRRKEANSNNRVTYLLWIIILSSFT
jgi:hypothetical protein